MFCPRVFLVFVILRYSQTLKLRRIRVFQGCILPVQWLDLLYPLCHEALTTLRKIWAAKVLSARVTAQAVAAWTQAPEALLQRGWHQPCCLHRGPDCKAYLTRSVHEL